MFEVGETALYEHQEILNLAHKLDITSVFAIGPSFGQSIPLDANQKVFSSYDDLTEASIANLPENSTLLIKGSRGMKMERILDRLA